MQDRYVGDVGDFGKYGLLRALSIPRPGWRPLSLGVVWYLVPDEHHSKDGNRISYLRLPPDRAAFFRDCDPQLYDLLQRLVQDGGRRVESVQEARVLPAGTVFYARKLTFAHIERVKSARRSHRTAWLEGACAATTGCDVVFLDPDNGFGSSVSPYQKAGIKYAYPEEVAAYLKRGQSVVVYHHLGRRGTTRQQVARQFSRLSGLRHKGSQFAMLYRRGAARAFFVLEPAAHKGRLHELALEMLSGPWARHFVLLEPAKP